MIRKSSFSRDEERKLSAALHAIVRAVSAPIATCFLLAPCRAHSSPQTDTCHLHTLTAPQVSALQRLVDARPDVLSEVPPPEEEEEEAQPGPEGADGATAAGTDGAGFSSVESEEGAVAELGEGVVAGEGDAVHTDILTLPLLLI